MNVPRVVLVVFVLSIVLVNVQAQARLIGNPTTSANIPPAPAPSTIAIIDSGAFTEETGGITRVLAALKQLNSKFDGVNNELKGMEGRLTNLRTDIQKKQATQPANVTAQQTEQADQLELQIKRKAEDARAEYQKQMETSLGPLQTDVSNALKTYAQSHGILLIIDVSRVPLMYANDSIDVTKDFIAEYNRTHPAGAAPTRP